MCELGPTPTLGLDNHSFELGANFLSSEPNPAGKLESSLLNMELFALLASGSQFPSIIIVTNDN